MAGAIAIRRDHECARYAIERQGLVTTWFRRCEKLNRLTASSIAELKGSICRAAAMDHFMTIARRALGWLGCVSVLACSPPNECEVDGVDPSGCHGHAGHGGSAGLAGAAGNSGAGGHDHAGPRLQIGEQQTLLENGALGLTYFPDMGTSIVSPPPNLRLILTALNASYRVEGTDLTDLTSAERVLGPGDPGSFDNGYAGISAVVAVGDTLYGYYHAEDQEGLPEIPGGIPGYYASIGVATSRDGGITWIKRGQAITSSQSKEWEAYPGQGDRGAAEPGAVVTRDGTAVLLYYTEHSRVDGRAVDICVARADIAAGAPIAGSFWKYRDGAFREPGHGGMDTPVVTAARFQDANALEAHVTWSEHAQRYLMVLGIDAWAERMSGQEPQVSGLYYTWSSDGVSWGELRQLIVDQAVPQPGKSLSWEASVLWDDENGHTGWLVYGYSPDWPATPHYFVGRRLTVNLE